MNKKVLILLAVVWTAALGLVGFSELRLDGSSEPVREAASPGPAEEKTAGPKSGEQASSGRQTSADSDGGPEDSSESAASERPDSGGAKPDGITLQLGGEPGQEFTGRCTVDGEEHELGGQTPQTYDYEPAERLECEISSLDRGPLRVTFSDDAGTNTVQQVGPQPGTLKLTYTENSLSTSISSGTRTNGAQMSSSQSSGSQVSSSQSSQVNSSQTSGSQVSSQHSSQSSSSVVRSGSE